jgi:hypothetical protein
MKNKTIVRGLLVIVAVLGLILPAASVYAIDLAPPTTPTFTHQVFLTNNSSASITTGGALKSYYVKNGNAPCGSGSSNSEQRLVFDKSTLGNGQTAVATYSTTASEKVDVIHLTWGKDGSSGLLHCEARPGTCGNTNTKNYSCTVTQTDTDKLNSGNSYITMQ